MTMLFGIDDLMYGIKTSYLDFITLTKISYWKKHSCKYFLYDHMILNYTITHKINKTISSTYQKSLQKIIICKNYQQTQLIKSFL